MTPEQLAKRLGVSLRMVREMYYTASWPHLRLNKRAVRFTEDHYNQIIGMSERRASTVMSRATSSHKASGLAALLGSKKSAYLEPISRIEFEIEDIPDEGPTSPDGPRPYAGINFFEVSVDHRRRGYGAKAIELLKNPYGGLARVAFSDDADKFSGSVGRRG
ncbi:hypothetical protein [Arthrobacter sp. OY3WO11]|uniref:hypothetical protein n=1 Tax=Arthrobacter sp. OY3WO11 TaxID=1835723 RepID=UPI0012E841B2|nr:hypothetical protein [Arthrobacter sp. OY3WO11]